PRAEAGLAPGPEADPAWQVRDGRGGRGGKLPRMTEFIPPGTRWIELPAGFAMKRGGRLAAGRVAYETWGRPNAAGDNAILILTGLSPDAHAAAGDANPAPGWWEAMVGPGKAIDTSRWYV